MYQSKIDKISFPPSPHVKGAERLREAVRSTEGTEPRNSRFTMEVTGETKRPPLLKMELLHTFLHI